MQTYVSLVKFTQHGLQTMRDKGIERAEMVKQNAKSLGGKLVQAYYCLGEYDVVAIWEFPDNKTAMRKIKTGPPSLHACVADRFGTTGHSLVEWTEGLIE